MRPGRGGMCVHCSGLLVRSEVAGERIWKCFACGRRACGHEHLDDEPGQVRCRSCGMTEEA